MALLAPPVHAQTAYTPLIEALDLDTSPEHIEALIVEYAGLYKLNYPLFRAVLNCESKLKPDAIGDHGTSYGIAQIHLPAWPDISKEQALNPDWAIRWAAQQWSKGNAKAWTCYRLLTEGG